MDVRDARRARDARGADEGATGTSLLSEPVSLVETRKRFEREFAADDREMSANHATFASHALCIRR